MEINRIDPAGLPEWDVIHMADMLVRLGRAVHPKRWVEAFSVEEKIGSFTSIM